VFEAYFDKRITIHGNGEQVRTFIHIDLIAHALARVLKTNLPGGTYNLVERSLKVIDIVDELKQLMPNLEFIMINQHIRHNHLVVQANEQVNRLLGITNTKSLKEEIQEFISRFSF
jgi:UDP-glucose 4-epimerase